MSFLRSIAEYKKIRYDELKANYPYVLKWKWYYYRRWKVAIYFETSSVLAYIFVKLRIKPNYITAVYVIMGISGGVLLAVPSHACIYLAIAFYYFRGVFDWTDGLVARVMNQSTISGSVFDSYGASAGWIFLWTGLGLYLGNYTSHLFYYICPIIPVLFAADLYSSARDALINSGMLQRSGKVAEESRKEVAGINSEGGGLRKIKSTIDNLFENNVRTVDLILLMILVETVSQWRILWVYYLCFLGWQITIFIIRFLMIIRGGWAESELEKLRRKLY